MASQAHSTPARPLARINPTWTPAFYPLGDLAPFFRPPGRQQGVTARPRPIQPLPAAEAFA